MNPSMQAAWSERRESGVSTRWRSPRRPLPLVEALGIVEVWKRRLGVTQSVELVRISPLQVTGESGQPGCSLVGVVYDATTARIYHTRAVTVEDIVHELIHVAYPALSEAAVVAETNRLLAAPPGAAPRTPSAAGSSLAVERGRLRQPAPLSVGNSA
jgi:hypothetical protein